MLSSSSPTCASIARWASLFVRILSVLLFCAAGRAQSTLYIESCNLGCSSGGGGGQVSCAVTNIAANQELRVRFSRAIDPASINSATFQIINVFNGSVPIGARFVDPLDDHVVVFRPAILLDSLGNLTFGFEFNSTYAVRFPGEAQGDSPPFVQSTDQPPLSNQSRMNCAVITSAGVLLTGIPYCAGTSACPCANPGSAGRGCANSQNASGLGLEATGSASVVSDSLSLYLRGFPTGNVQFFQGTVRENGGAGTPFGDGLLCVGGDLLRLRSQVGGVSQQLIPDGDPRISVQGQIPASGATRSYQAFYRDAASFCTSATFNWTNAVEITWAP